MLGEVRGIQSRVPVMVSVEFNHFNTLHKGTPWKYQRHTPSFMVARDVLKMSDCSSNESLSSALVKAESKLTQQDLDDLASFRRKSLGVSVADCMLFTLTFSL